MHFPVSVDSITLSSREQQQLEQIVRRHTAPRRLVRRAHIVLLAASGHSNESIARRVEIGCDQVRLWRRRWLSTDCAAPAEQRLCDAQRPGAPATFCVEQICQIVALACENPDESGWPMTEWTASALAEEARRRGVVERISRSTVRNFLKSGRSEAPQNPLLTGREGRRPSASAGDRGRLP